MEPKAETIDELLVIYIYDENNNLNGKGTNAGDISNTDGDEGSKENKIKESNI